MSEPMYMNCKFVGGAQDGEVHHVNTNLPYIKMHKPFETDMLSIGGLGKTEDVIEHETYKRVEFAEGRNRYPYYFEYHLVEEKP